MDNKVLPFISNFLLLIAVMVMVWSLGNKDLKIKDLLQSEKQFQEKHTKLQLELEAEQRNRVILLDSIADLQSGRDSLSQQIKLKDKELKAIKGRYKDHTPSQIEIEMEKRYNPLKND